MDDDKEIVACFAQDPEKGFRRLVKKYQQPIYWHIRRMVVSHDDAKDVLQETFLRIFRNLNAFRSDSSLSTWIYRIATNECLRWLDKRKEEFISDEEVHQELLNQLMASEYVDYDQAMEVRFQKAILSLPDKQRLVFNLRYYDDLSYEAMKEITGSTIESLKVNYHLAKEKIKQYMINNE